MDLDDLLPSLDPPPGGYQALRDRLERPRHRWVPWLLLPAAAAMLFALALRPTATPLLERHERRAAATPGEHTALTVVSSSPDVLYIRVVTTE